MNNWIQWLLFSANENSIDNIQTEKRIQEIERDIANLEAKLAILDRELDKTNEFYNEAQYYKEYQEIQEKIYTLQQEKKDLLNPNYTPKQKSDSAIKQTLHTSQNIQNTLNRLYKYELNIQNQIYEYYFERIHERSILFRIRDAQKPKDVYKFQIDYDYATPQKINNDIVVGNPFIHRIVKIGKDARVGDKWDTDIKSFNYFRFLFQRVNVHNIIIDAMKKFLLEEYYKENQSEK